MAEFKQIKQFRSNKFALELGYEKIKKIAKYLSYTIEESNGFNFHINTYKPIKPTFSIELIESKNRKIVISVESDYITLAFGEKDYYPIYRVVLYDKKKPIKEFICSSVKEITMNLFITKMIKIND